MTNILVPKLFGFAQNFVFVFSAPPFSVGETLHVAYKNIKEKENLPFFGKYQGELKTSEYSFVLNTLDEIYLEFTSKKVNIHYVFR